MIKISTKPIVPTIKIGDVIQFDDFPPVKAVKFKDCSLCYLSETSHCHTRSSEFADFCVKYCVTKRNVELMFAEVKE